MIGECMDVLFDVLKLPHRPAVNDHSVTDCVTLQLPVEFFFFL